MKACFFWDHCSQYENPSPDYYYTQPLIYDDVEARVRESFSLGVKQTEDDYVLLCNVNYHDASGMDDINTLYEVGRWPIGLDNKRCIESIQKYSHFIAMHLYGEGYGMLAGLPNVEVVDNWDAVY